MTEELTMVTKWMFVEGDSPDFSFDRLEPGYYWYHHKSKGKSRPTIVLILEGADKKNYLMHPGNGELRKVTGLIQVLGPISTPDPPDPQTYWST